MYSEIEKAIVDALKEEFKNDPVLKPDMIMPAIVLKNPKRRSSPSPSRNQGSFYRCLYQRTDIP